MRSPRPFAPPATEPGQALPDRFRAAWHSIGVPPRWRRLLVAVSGGPDSLALLHLLQRTASHHRLDLVVAHADHGIHPDSAAVAAEVAAVAERLGLPLVIGRLQLGPDASETTARTARQDWLEQARAAQGADAIAYGHHRDDQVETVLMRALGGSGTAGLAGMAPRRGRRVRPLLEFKKSELVAWLESNGIAGWTDPANSDPTHARSWVRNELLPRIEARAPEAGERLLRLGRHAASERDAWRAALDVIPGLDLQVDAGRVSVSILPLATFDATLATTLLQAAARTAGCVLGAARSARVLELARAGESGSTLQLGGAWRAELAFGRIGFHQAQSVPPPLALAGDHGAVRWGAWEVRWDRGTDQGETRRDGTAAWFIGEEAVVRGPRPGDRLVPHGGTGHRAVSRLLQEARVERSRRAGWPLVEVDGVLAWVGGVCRGSHAEPGPRERALRIEVTGG